MTKGRLWKEVILTKIANVRKMVNDSAFHNLNFHQWANFCQIYLFPQICQLHQIRPFLRTKPVQTLEHLNDTWSDLYVHCMYMYYPEQSMQSTFKDNMELTTKHIIITWNCFLSCLKTRALLGIDSLWFNSCKRPPPVSIVCSVRISKT